MFCLRSIWFPVLILLCGLPTYAQSIADTAMNQLFRKAPLYTISSPSANLIATDELGNLFLVRADNTIARFNSDGDSTGFYRNVSNGPVRAIDATNPMRVIVYYATQSRVVLLDRMMAPVAALDLRRINLFAPPAVAYSADGNLWVYDPFNAQLRKVDDQLKEIVASNELRQQVGLNPRPTEMLERNRRLYLNDTAHGILVFDQFASYIATLPLKGANRLQVVGNNLIYQKEDHLYSYNRETFQERSFLLPLKDSVPPIMVCVAREKLLMLYKDQLLAYALPQEWKN